jgi:hypothetical protein
MNPLVRKVPAGFLLPKIFQEKVMASFTLTNNNDIYNAPIGSNNYVADSSHKCNSSYHAALRLNCSKNTV